MAMTGITLKLGHCEVQGESYPFEIWHLKLCFLHEALWDSSKPKDPSCLKVSHGPAIEKMCPLILSSGGFVRDSWVEGFQKGTDLWWLSPLSLVRPRTPLCRCPAWPPTPPGDATLTNRNCTESSGAWLRGALSQTTLSSQPGCYHPVILDTLFTSLITVFSPARWGERGSPLLGLLWGDGGGK